MGDGWVEPEADLYFGTQDGSYAPEVGSRGAAFSRSRLTACLDRFAERIVTGGDEEKKIIPSFERIDADENNSSDRKLIVQVQDW